MNKWNVIARFLAGEASDEERNTVKQWTKDAADLDRFIHSVQHFFGKNSIDFNAYKEEDWNKIVERCVAPVLPAKSAFLYTRWIRIAASLLILITVGLAGIYWSQKEKEEDLYSYYQSENALREVVLADGTHVLLNKHSTLKVLPSFGKKTRGVVVQGEAFFNVTKNKTLPFEVRTGSIITRVLGTSFNVASETDSSVVVSVAEGRVGVRSTSGKAPMKQLVPGQAIVYTHRYGLGNVTAADVNYLSWKTGVIRFENKDLVYVCKFLSKHYSIDLKLSNYSLGDLTITTELANLSATDAIDVIAKTLNLRSFKKENTFYLTQ